MAEKIDLSKYHVAAIQMDIVPKEIELNRNHAVDMALQAIHRGAHLLVFPELSDIDMVDDARGLSTTVPGPFTSPLEKIAHQHTVHVVIGMSRREGNNLYNSAVFIGPGGILGMYDKVHVWAGSWDAAHGNWSEDPRRIEPHNYVAGNEFKVFQVDGITVGTIICYDGMFAESWLCNRLLSADLLLWPTNRGNYQDINVAEMARFFQLNVIAVNRFGQSNYWTNGDLQIVNARGDILAHTFNGETILHADLDIENSRKRRRSMPQLRDRRPDVYIKYIQNTPTDEMAPGKPSYQVSPRGGVGD